MQMLTKNLQDLLAGASVLVVGLGVSLYALFSYNLGTLSRMGPGMFPFGAGLIMALLGGVILLSGLLRAGEAIPRISIRPLVMVAAATAAFAMLIRPAGMLPAIAVMTVIASLADPRLKPLTVIVLIGVLCLIAWLVFIVALGLPIVLVRGWY